MNNQPSTIKPHPSHVLSSPPLSRRRDEQYSFDFLRFAFPPVVQAKMKLTGKIISWTTFEDKLANMVP
jgi:hypothetical protein